MDEIININTLVKDDISNLFKDSIICPICNSVLIDPMLCMKCQKTFCKKCIDSYPNNNEECPNKCSEPYYQKSIGKNDILSKLKFNCKKCGGEYYYHEIKSHYNSCDSNNSSNKIDNKKHLKRLSIENVYNIKRKSQNLTYITGKK